MRGVAWRGAVLHSVAMLETKGRPRRALRCVALRRLYGLMPLILIVKVCIALCFSCDALAMPSMAIIEIKHLQSNT